MLRYGVLTASLISIHALLAESDLAGPSGPAFLYNFYPRSPCGERREIVRFSVSCSVFLSTLSLRRATLGPKTEHEGNRISIHALLAESDQRKIDQKSSSKTFLSTLSLRRATANGGVLLNSFINFYPRSPCGERLVTVGLLMFNLYFYPRSPCGERRKKSGSIPPTAHFYPRSPCGERPAHFASQIHSVGISIHALLAESDF